MPKEVLELVAVAPRLGRGDHRLELEALEPADAGQRLGDLLLLDLELALVGQHLPRRPGVVGDGRDAVRRGLEYVDRARLGVGALGLGDHRAHAVAGQAAGDEDDVAAAVLTSLAPSRATPLPPNASRSTVRSSSAPRAGRAEVVWDAAMGGDPG